MPLSNYPGGFANGVTVRGLPLLNSYPGNVYWVDSTLGSDGNRGTFDKPLATVDKAMTFCTTGKGDIIVLKPGHAEDIANATTFQIDKANVAVIGLGSGAAMPTFTFTATAGSVEMDSAGGLIQNVRFLASVSAVVVGVNVDASDCAIVGCEFDFDASGDDFLRYVDCEDVERTEISGCRFIAEVAAGSNEAIRLDNADYTKIKGNFFYGDFARAPIWSDTSGDTGNGSTVSIGIQIEENSLYQGDTTLGIAIDLNNADTGVIAYNRLGGPTGLTTFNLLDPGSCMCIQNYAVNAVDETGALIPATVAT